MSFRKPRDRRLKPNPGASIDWSHGLSRDLVAYWPVTEGGGKKVSDIARTSHGDWSVGMTQTATTGWMQGKFGKAIGMDGVDDHILVPHKPALALVGDLTFCAWVWVNNTSTYHGLFGKTTTNKPHPYDWYVSNTGALTMIVGNGTDYHTFAATVAVTANKWQFYTSIVKGTTCYHLIDGVVVSSGAMTVVGSTARADGGGDLRIGSRADNVTKLTGRMENCRMYNRALIQAEVRELYTNPFAGIVQARVGMRSTPPAAGGAPVGKIFYFPQAVQHASSF